MNSRIALCALAIAGFAPAQDTGAAWKKLEFLLGDWIGFAGQMPAELGSGQGSFSFTPELKRNIVVRRNRAEYSTGASHDDLMIIYFDPPGGAPRAIDFDTEGHVIRYDVTFPSVGSAVFESEKGQTGPRYRLSYQLTKDSLDGKFEIAQTGADYKTYLTWRSRKK